MAGGQRKVFKGFEKRLPDKEWQSFLFTIRTRKINCEKCHNVTILSSKCDNVHKENERSMNGDL
mgnify:CR=1 FL=1